MEIERVFRSCFFIEKKLDDIFTLVEAALQVGTSKFPDQFQKRKNRIIKFLMDPSDDFIEEDGVSVGDEEEVTNVKEKEESEKEKQIHAQSKKPLRKKKTVQVAYLKKENNCNATIESVMELKKTLETDLVQQQLDDADKQGTPQSHNITTMVSRKRMSMNMSTKRVEVVPPVEKQLCSLKKQLKKQKVNMEKKREEGSQQTPTKRRSVNTKSMSPPLPLMKIKEATKLVDIAHQKKLLSDCSPSKQSNCSSITRSMQKETKSITDKKKFESTKRKFEERLAEQREAKRRIVMVDFHDMPKPAKDPHAPKGCWDRRRF